ncbi:hypothetical protein LVB77_16455 [Lysobacter sp. 5GHs7-4]|uniref:hypothetical protein n=1 Tax=Lysobacter sp. 5GHs7-4 TaxID=2904253 RepID=UPI001E4E9A59|nr:hypothetical protein [Lysobacter sp. 5GHs7-4]UHQ22244.1 hypothetical protein LVB77_16455 [Lysobacter sp. 5GHs7-4]
MDTDTRMPLPQGMYRDVLRDADGRVIWDRGWAKNAILTDCRRLLAAFMGGTPGATLGIQGLAVGAGLASWDQVPPPPPTGNETGLTDPSPFVVPGAALDFTFMDGPVPSATPTNRLQIVATLGPNVPPWPNGSHASGNLREFGLIAQLGGAPTQINLVRHPVVAKDPASTLERTIWLVF